MNPVRTLIGFALLPLVLLVLMVETVLMVATLIFATLGKQVRHIRSWMLSHLIPLGLSPAKTTPDHAPDLTGRLARLAAEEKLARAETEALLGRKEPPAQMAERLSAGSWTERTTRSFH